MYLKKEYRELLEKINKEMKIPKGWYYFVKKVSEKHNFIVKSCGICTCRNCNTQFKSNKKINEYETCPKCKNTYLIKRKTYTWHIFTDVVILLDRIDENWVIRLFEIFTRYTDSNIYHSKAAEYGRIVLTKYNEIHFANNRAITTMWGETYVNHTQDGKKWRIFGGYYNKMFSNRGRIYCGNIKKLCENTELEYSQLWTVAKKNEYIDILKFLKNNYKSTEMLAKMQLYNLAKYPEIFNKEGSFFERFGISKDYYEFMKNNNISLEELEILKIYKKKDIEGIRLLKEFNIRNIKEVTEFMELGKFVAYVKAEKNFDISLYLDYLSFLKKLNIDIKNKRNLFPDNLILRHDEYAEQIAIKNNPKLCRAINKRYNQLKKYSYTKGNYCIIPAKSFTALEDESRQQNHCVRTYADKYAKGKCDIYFMRKTESPEKSLVTIEVVNQHVTQSRIKNNGNPTDSQKNVLKQWEREILKAA